MNLFQLIKTDVHFQYKHGFYFIYGFITTLYIGLIHFVPNKWSVTTTQLLLYSDCSFLGAFFIGGIFLLEKDQGILAPLFITPIKKMDYIISKTLSLCLLSLLSSYLILLGTWNIQWNILYVTVSVGLSSIFATLLGMLIVMHVQSLNEYLLSSPFLMTILCLPVMETLDFISWEGFKFFPSYSSLYFLEHGITNFKVQVEDWLNLGILYTIVIFLLFWLVHRTLKKRIIIRGVQK